MFEKLTRSGELALRWLSGGVFILLLMHGAAGPAPVAARDYMVELFEEHYREEMVTGAGEPKIYHCWQVKTIYGDKLLVLIGKDRQYRQWLRKSCDKHRLFIVKIPGAGDDRFKYDRAVLVDVQQVHAVWERWWSCDGCRHGSPPPEPEPNIDENNTAG